MRDEADQPRAKARLIAWRAADRLLQAAAADGYIADADLEAVLALLLRPNGWRYRARARLIQRLSRLQLSSQQRRAAADALLRIAGENARADQAGRLARWALLSAALSLLLVVSFDFSPANHPLDWLYAMAAGLLGALPMAVVVAPVAERSEAVRRAAVRAAAIDAVGLFPSPEAAPMVAAACRQRGIIGRVARRSLPTVLATLRPEHYRPGEGRLTPDLCRLLPGADDDLLRDILRALERAGDGRGVEAVEALAARTHSDRVAARAREVAGLLRERRTRERQASTLLRPTEAPDDPAAILLRPAPPGGANADADLLVRPSAPPEE
ncbi:MAG: hypothetical protein NT029_11960 [Armatimonadetes bacterium]|nr:hypothetical protein [Armatimonadota bacterium]